MRDVPVAMSSDGHGDVATDALAPAGIGRAAELDMNLRKSARLTLGAALLFTGVGHLTFLRRSFRAQVPDFVPLPIDTTVRYSGVAELAMGTSLILGPEHSQPALGRFVAGFFATVFSGNLSQWWHRRSAFGLDTDGKRFARLFFQPVLVYWALKSTERR